MENSQTLSTTSDPFQDSKDALILNKSFDPPSGSDRENSPNDINKEFDFDLEEVRKQRKTILNQTKKKSIKDSQDVQALVSNSLLKNKSVINMRHYQEMDNLAKIEALKNYVPKLQSESKLCPLSKIDSLKAHSMSYYHYFNLYRLSIGLVFIQLLLTFLTTTFLVYVIGSVPLTTVYWVDFGLVLGLGIPVISFSRYKIEKKLVEKTSRQEEQTWTEDKFALVVENLNRKSTKPEIKEFLDKILIKAGCRARVHKIISLQECNTLAELEIEYKKASELLKKEYDSKKHVKIQKKIKEYEQFLAQIEKFERYNGKTIVVFETMEAKLIVLHYFKRINPIKRYFYSICCNCCKCGLRFKLHEKIPYVSNAPEPADFIYENAHFSLKKRLFNELFAHAIGGSFIAALFVVIIALKVIADTQFENNAFQHYFLGGICTLLNSVIGISGGRLVDAFFIRRRKSSYNLEQIILKIRLIFINTVVFFSVMMYNMNAPEFQEFIQGNAISLLIVVPLTKIGLHLFDRISLKKKRNQITNAKDLSIYSQQEIINALGKPQLKISLYVGTLANYIFISTSFYFIGGWIICFFGLLGLIVNVIFDKYMMLNHLSPLNTKNSETGLHFYEILRFEIPLQLLPLASFENLLLGTHIEVIMVLLYVAFGVTMLYPRKSIVSLWKKAWTDKRLYVKYDEVKSQFPHTYEQEYLFEVY